MRPRATPLSRRHRRVGAPTWLVAVGVVVGLVGLFFYFYTRSAMWLDEALTLNIARLPLSDLTDALKHDGAPPLYYLLLHAWTAVFGTTNVAVRSLSAVCMTGAVVAVWFAGRRLVGGAGAWIAAGLMLSSPYAIRYATEARMYSLVVLLVAVGILAVERALDAPTIGRLALVAVLVAAMVYTQYWTFYLLIVVFGTLAWVAWRGERRRAARRILVAMVVGGLAFVPWLPTFLYQRAHTGTPWGSPVLPGIPIGYTLRDFAGGASGTAADRQEGWLLFVIVFTLLVFGVFARGIDGRRLEIDLTVPAGIRGIAFVGGAGLVVAVSLNYVAGGTFQSRYSAIVFPFFVLIVARGFTTLRDPRVLGAVLAIAILLGFVGGARNVQTQRTQAPGVAAILRAKAKPGDVVIYCPDQLGPAVHRLAPKGLDEFVFPSFAGPEFVDWVDYKARIRAASVPEFATKAIDRARSHAIWFVTAPGYTTHAGKCEALSDALAKARGGRTQLTASDDTIFEKPALQYFPARPTG